MCEEYNGWPNRETWLVGVHDFFSYEMVQEAITEMTAKPPEKEVIAKGLNVLVSHGQMVQNYELGGVVRAYTLQLADWMEEQHSEFIEEATENMNLYIKDLIADHKIDWLNIAEHYTNEIAEALKEKV